MSDTVLLIDAHNFVYRGVMQFPKKDAAPSAEWGTSAPPAIQAPPLDEYVVVFNFFRNLRVLIEQFQPVKAFFVLEGHPQFRYDLHPEYKANRIVKTGSTRSEANERFEKSLPDILRLLKCLPIDCARAVKYEADDAIASLAENMREENIIIVSNDTDFIQVLQKGYRNVKVYAPTKKVFMEAPEYPYVFFKTLKGDKSDNINGLPGIGEKRAEKLCRNPEKLREFLSIEENRAHQSINQKLIEFRSVPLFEIEIEEGGLDFEALKNEFTKMAFQTIIQEPYWSKFCHTFDCLKY